MKSFFRKLFHIYPGEEKSSLMFACLAFFWSFAVTAGLKFADALFLIHVGAEYLPTVYIITACIMIGIAAILLRVFHVLTPGKIFTIALSLGITFYLFAFFCLQINIGTESDWLWYGLRIFGFILFAVAVTCFWTFVDQYHDLQDAKRLYGLFSSMIFLGVASTGFIMRSGLIEFQPLTIGIVILLLLAIFWIRKISSDIKPVHDETDLEAYVTPSEHSFKTLLRSILQSRFTMLLMLGNFLTYVLLVLTEYSYLSDFDHRFDTTHPSQPGGEATATLTLFLGQLVTFVSLGNLLFGLFVYSRLVKRFGSTSLLIVTPTVLLITFSGWPLTDSLIFPILGYLVVEGTLYVIDDSNFNLMLNAVPSKVKYKIRVIIESFFEPIGMLTSAMLLTISWIDSKILGLILSFVLLIVVLSLQSRYFKAIYRNLSENAIHFQRSLQVWLEKMNKKDQKLAEHRLLDILNKGEHKAQLFAAEGLIAFDDPKIIPKILETIDQLDAKSKIQFIHMLAKSSFASDADVLDTLHAWAYDENEPLLRGTIHYYLASQGLLHPDRVMPDLKSQDILLRGAAILALKNLSSAQMTHNRTLADQHLQQLLHSDSIDEVIMGIKIIGDDALPYDVDVLIPYLKNPNVQITRAAANSIAQLADKYSQRIAPALIDQLELSKDNEVRLACLRALGKMEDSSLVKPIIGASTHFRSNERRMTKDIMLKMGLKTVPALISLTKDSTLNHRCRLLAGRILGQLALPQLRANLAEILNKEIDRAYFYLHHYNTVQKLNPQLDLHILRDALLSSYHSVQDFIIQLLGIAGDIEDCELLARSMRSRNLKIRSTVVETLERTCESPIYRLLQPLLADIPDTEKSAEYLRRGGQQLSLSELLDILSESSSQLDQIIAAMFKHRLNLSDWRSTLIKQLSSNEEIFHHFAYELLET